MFIEIRLCNLMTYVFKGYVKIVKMVSGQLPPEENCPRLGLGFGSRSRLVLGLGGNQAIAPEEDCPRLGLGFGLGLVFGVERGRQFSSGATVLEPVKIYMVNFNVSILNRLKIMGFL